MALELSGVRLVADNAAQFLAQMRAGDAAMASFAQATGRAASDATAFARATQQIKLDSLNNQLRDQQTRLGILKQQLADVAAKYGDASTQAQAKAAAVAKLSGAVDVTKSKIGLLAQQMAAEADAAADGARGNQKLAGSLDDVEAGAGKAESALQRIATGALHKIGALGVEAFGRLTEAAVGFVADGVQGVADFQSEISMLGAVSNAGAADLDKARAAARALGSDLTLPTTSANTAAEAMTELVKAGLSVDQAIGAAKATLQVATIEQLSNADAAEIVANALNMFSLKGEQATMVADQFAAASGASSISLKDAAIALANGGSVWAAFQSPTVGATNALTDFNTAVALLGNAGIKGSSAGTALKNAMLFLAAPTDKANDLMHELMGNIGETGTLAFDSSGKMRSFSDILELTRRATAGLSEAQRDAALKTIFGGDAVAAILPLLKAGGDGWAAMEQSVTRAGAANDLAAAKMKGINGAVKGLQSGLETLALNALEPLAPLIESGIGALGQLVSVAADNAGPAMTVVAQALVAVGDGVGATVAAIQTGLVPALGVATAAAITFAAMNAGQVGIALALVAQRLILATAGFVAHAGAVALAAAPYAAIALAIGGVILAYNKFNDAVKGTVQDALDSRQWWQQSGQALQQYGQATQETQAKLAAHAATIKELRSEIQGELEDLTRRAAAGMLTDAQYQTEMAAINGKREGLIQVTAAMESEIGAMVRQQAAATNATALTNAQSGATQNLGVVANLTAEQVSKLADELVTIVQKGATALATYAGLAATYMATTEQSQADHQQRLNDLIAEKGQAQTDEQKAQIDKRIAQENEGYAQQQQNAAAAYAAQAAAQRVALGEQLLAYIENQRQLGNITDEKAGQMREATITHFGIMRDSAAAMFGEMAQSVDNFASSANGSADDVVASWQRTEDKAVDLKAKADALEKKYTMDIWADFDAGRITLDEARRKLEALPTRVSVEIAVTEKHYTSGAGDHVQGGGVSGTRAAGGPVALARTYLVGEKGPELFVPNSNGYIIPHHKLAGARADGGFVQGLSATGAVAGLAGQFSSGGSGSGGGDIADIMAGLRSGRTRSRRKPRGPSASQVASDSLTSFLAGVGGGLSLPGMTAAAAAALAGRNDKLIQIEQDGAKQLRDIDAWYADQQRQLAGNPETLATLKAMYDKRVSTAKAGLEQQRQAELQAAEQQRRDKAQQAAEQQAEQQRQQGRQLISYIQEEAKKKPALKAQSDALIAQVRARYGIEDDLMANSLDAQKQRLADFFTSGGTADPAKLAAALSGADRSAGATTSARKDLSAQFTEAFQKQFQSGQIGQAQLTAALLAIPSLVSRAMGSGYQVPALGGMNGGGGGWSYQDNRQYQMPIYTNQSPAALQQGYYTMRALIP